MNARYRVAVCLLAASLAACSSASRIQRHQDAREAVYEAAAGAPVRSFHFINLYSWDALGERNAAIYTRADEAWLLDFDGPCTDIDEDHGIVLTSFGNEVVAGVDRVEGSRPAEPCRIRQIRAVDMARLKKRQKAKLEIRSAPRGGRQIPLPKP